MNAYIDTSILSAYYSPELGSPQAQALLTELDGAAISWLTETELISAMTKQVRVKAMTKADATKIIDCFTRHISSGYYEILAVSRADYQMAQRLIQQTSAALRSLDGLHLAIALRAQRTLATADKALAKAAKQCGINTIFIDYQ